MEHQLGSAQRLGQRLLELHPLDHGDVHLGFEDLLLALALGLCPVESEVGVSQQVVGLVAADGDPDRGSDQHFAAEDLERLVHRIEDPVCRVGDRRLVDVLEQDDELIAAEAGRCVGGAHAFQQASRSIAQDLVAGDVSEAVVDVLEGVEVDEQDSDPRAGAGGAGERVVEPVHEQQPVRQPGERVVERLVDGILDRLRIGQRQARVLGQCDQHVALGGGVPPSRPVGGDDEAADHLAVLANRRGERRPNPVLGERRQRPVVAGVVLDRDQLRLLRGSPAGAEADRAAQLAKQLRPDAGRGHQDQL